MEASRAATGMLEVFAIRPYDSSGDDRSSDPPVSEFLQYLSHLVSTFTAADIDDNICIGPLGDLVLGHGFSGTETTGNSGGAAFCDWEHGIQDTLTGDQRPGCRETSFGRTGNTDRPFLAQGEFLCGSVGKFQCDDRIHDRVSAVRGCFDNGSLHIRRNMDR